MKKVLLLLMTGLSLSACTSSPENEGAIEKNKKSTAEYALSVNEAMEYIERYDSVTKVIMAKAGLGSVVPIRSYTVRAIDLFEALGVPSDSVQYINNKFTHARVYIGMDDNNNFRLFLTPVQGAQIADGTAGKDVVLSGDYTSGLAATAGSTTDSGPYVMDFTMPCPNSCPPEILDGNQ